MFLGLPFIFSIVVFFGYECTLGFACFDRLCEGPKFARSNCCEGFICVGRYQLGAPDVLECVDEDEHFRVKSVEEIISELDREEQEEKSFSLDEFVDLENLTLPFYDRNIALLAREYEELDDDVSSKDFNKPVVIESTSLNITQ